MGFIFFENCFSAALKTQNSDTKQQINMMLSKIEEHEVIVYFKQKKELENMPEMSSKEQVKLLK